jgi:histidine triad (HIT) family protein
MTLDADCIFCKIVRGEVPSFKLYEDDKTLAFMDINPVNPGHALVVPKFHSPNLFRTPPEWVSAAILTTQKIAIAVQRTLNPYGMNILQANGPGAAQSVLHFHMHVVPRAKDDEMKMNWGLKPGDKDVLKALADQIKANIE